MMQRKDFSSLLLERQDTFAEAIVKKQYQLQSATWSPYGTVGQQKSLRDMKYHLAYLAEAIATSSPDLFFDYVAWVKILFNGLGFSSEVLATTLECTYSELLSIIGEEATPILDAYVQAAQKKLDQVSTNPPLFVNPNLPLGGLANEYLQALLRGDRHTATTMVLDAVDRGISIQNIYLHVFQNSQYEIGRLWQINKITVAQEHYCTAATQMIMSQLYPKIFASMKSGKKFVSTCVGGELHEVGIRIVTDFFEIEGWDTYYLGANMPVTGILSTIEEQEPDIIGISTTITYHLSETINIIEEVRRNFAGTGIKILVGGYPFLVDKNLWREIGADGFGADASSAIKAANQFMASS